MSYDHKSLRKTGPVVSIIIPVYNYGCYLEKAIRSVLAQTFTEYEILVIDDGSEEDIPSVIQLFNDSRIRYYRKERQGQSAARNQGIQLARGEYIAFLDADDEWYPEKIGAQLEVLKIQPRVGLVYCHCEYIDNQGKVIDVVKYHLRGNQFITLLRANYITGTSSTILVRRACFEQVGGFSTELTAVEDWHLVIRISAHWEIDFVDQVLARITYHPASWSKNLERVKHNTIKTLSLLEAEFGSRAPKSVWRRAYSYAHLTIGRAHGLNGDMIHARQSFWQSVRADPSNFVGLVFFISSLFGSSLYGMLRKLKRMSVPKFGL